MCAAEASVFGPSSKVMKVGWKLVNVNRMYELKNNQDFDQGLEIKKDEEAEVKETINKKK